MSPKSFRKAARVISAVNCSLVNFISGQLTEAVVLGTLCFCGMVVLGFEYPLLISTIIGVTALIPVAGAFIGAIPSALVLFLVKPSSALWFIVFIIVLQQLENNLIYPKVVGKSGAHTHRHNRRGGAGRCGRHNAGNPSAIGSVYAH